MGSNPSCCGCKCTSATGLSLLAHLCTTSTGLNICVQSCTTGLSKSDYGMRMRHSSRLLDCSPQEQRVVSACNSSIRHVFACLSSPVTSSVSALNLRQKDQNACCCCPGCRSRRLISRVRAAQQTETSTAAKAAAAAGLIANPVVLVSEYFLKTTGEGLPPGAVYGNHNNSLCLSLFSAASRTTSSDWLLAHPIAAIKGAPTAIL